MLEGLSLEVVAFDAASAFAVGALRRTTRHAGLALGDRTCLALALAEAAPALTADRAWATLALDIEVEVVR